MTEQYKCILLVNDVELISEVVDEGLTSWTLLNPCRVTTAPVELPDGSVGSKLFLTSLCPYSVSEEYKITKGMILTTGEVADPLIAFYKKIVRQYKEQLKESERIQKENEMAKEDQTLKNGLQNEGKLGYFHTHTTKQ